MAEKYIVDGATYCGKGNGPNIATANDEDGAAWNNINVFTTGATPAYGTAPAAGDIVYIRSKNASGADITVNFNSASLTIGSANGTNVAPITWVIDGGTKWSGINGTFTFSQTTNTGNYGVTLRDFNWLKAENPQKLVVSQGSGVDKIGSLFLLGNGGLIENALFDTSGNASGSYGGVFQSMNTAASGYARWANCYFKFGNYYIGAIKIMGGSGSLTEFVNCTIELTRSETITDSIFSFFSPGYGAGFRAIGGEIKGVGAASMQRIVGDGDRNYASFIGTKIPGVETVKLYTAGNNNYATDFCSAFGADGGVGSDFFQPWGFFSSRADNNPPYLNATLPDSAATAWAWYIYPRGITGQATFSAHHPHVPLSKLYTDTAVEQKKITVECLISTTCANVNKRTVWIDVTYIDNDTGLPVTVSTQDITGTAALATSSAPWSSTSWGTKSFNKYKLEVTTVGDVKPDTAVHVSFHYLVGAPNSSDVAFLCPDFQMVAA